MRVSPALLCVVSLGLLYACGGSAPADGGLPIDSPASLDAPAHDAPAVDAPAVDAPPSGDGATCTPLGGDCTVDSDCCSGSCFVVQCT